MADLRPLPSFFDQGDQDYLDFMAVHQPPAGDAAPDTDPVGEPDAVPGTQLD